MASEPSIESIGGVYKLTFGDEHLEVVVDRLKNEYAEITIVTTNSASPGHLLVPTRINLLSAASRKSIAKILDLRHELEDWEGLLQQICGCVLLHSRTGEPTEKLGDKAPDKSRINYRLRPLLCEGEANLIFGAGGVGKSYLACFIGLLVQSGEAICKLEPQQGNVLFLDWETNRQNILSRLYKINVGNFPGSEQAIYYRRCWQSLRHEVVEIQRLVLELDIKLIIVDSVGPAIGGDIKDAAEVLMYFNALRSLDITSLSIDHVNKQSEGIGALMGSVYKANVPRAVWKVKSEHMGQGELILGVYDEKRNDAKPQNPIGLRMQFIDDEAVSFTEDNPLDYPDLSGDAPLSDRMTYALKHRGKTVKSLAEELDSPEGSVRKILNRYKGRRFVALLDGQWGNVARPE